MLSGGQDDDSMSMSERSFDSGPVEANLFLVGVADLEEVMTL